MESALAAFTYASPVFLWSVVLGNFIWINRDQFYHKTKQCLKNLARSVVSKSKRILNKRWSLRFRKKERKNKEVMAEEPQKERLSLSYDVETDVIERNRQAQITDEMSTISRRVSKPIKKYKNINKISRNLEQCIMKRAYARTLKDSEVNYFREQLSQIEDRKWSGDVMLAKKQSLQNYEDLQKFVEEQLDDEDEELFMLPYDPFYQSEQQQNGTKQEQNEAEQEHNEGQVQLTS